MLREPLEWLRRAMFYQVGLRTFYAFGKHSKISKKEIRFVCFYQLDIITEFFNFEERSFSGLDFSRRGGGVRMLKNANSVPDVPRILIIRLKRRSMYVQVCAFPATDVLIVIGTFPLQFACPFPLILELYS